MPLASSAGLLSLALLTSTADAAERPPLPPCEAGDIRIEVDVSAPGRVAALCITPELTSTLLFDAKLSRVELEGREHFRRVTEAVDSLMVVPSESMRDMEPQRATVYFADGAAPASLTFLLVIHPARAARQVDVIRKTLPVDFYKQKARDADAKAQRCEEEKARILAEQGGPGGLRSLRAAGLLDQARGVLPHVTGRLLPALFPEAPGGLLPLGSALLLAALLPAHPEHPDRLGRVRLAQPTGSWPSHQPTCLTFPVSVMGYPCSRGACPSPSSLILACFSLIQRAR